MKTREELSQLVRTEEQLKEEKLRYIEERTVSITQQIINHCENIITFTNGTELVIQDNYFGAYFNKDTCYDSEETRKTLKDKVKEKLISLGYDVVPLSNPSEVFLVKFGPK